MRENLARHLNLLSDKQHSAFSRVALSLVTFCLSTVILSLRVAYAQTSNVPCNPPPYPPTRIIQLVEEIRQSEPRDLPRGEFAQREAFVFLEGNEIICLSSTRDGRGVLQVDDHLEFQVTHADGGIATWAYDFYDKVTGGITTTPSQDVSRLFAPRLNGVRITLRDFFPRYYSAFPVWLIIWQGPTPTPTRTSTATRIPTPTFVPTLITLPSPTSSPIATSALVPTPTSSLVSVVETPTVTPERPTPGIGISYGLCAIVLVPVVIIMAMLLTRNWQAGENERRWNTMVRQWEDTLDVAERSDKYAARNLIEQVIKDVSEYRKSLQNKSE